MLVSQGVLIDRERHRVTIEEDTLDLTPSEFGLLEALIRQPGRVFSRSELIDAALGGDSLVLGADDRRAHSLAAEEAGQQAVLVETVRGMGYRFRDPISAMQEVGVPATCPLRPAEREELEVLPRDVCVHVFGDAEDGQVDRAGEAG